MEYLEYLRDIKGFKKLHELLSNQTILKLLHLDDEAVRSVVDFPLNIQCKLEDLKLTGFSFQFNVYQQNNLCDFIDTQDQLKLRECKFVMDDEKTEKMNRFLAERLNKQLKSQYIVLQIGRSYNYMYGSISFTIESFIQATSDQPNLMTEKLYIENFYLNINQVVLTLITNKFPNLKTIDFNIKYLQYETGFAVLSNLKKLESITLVNTKSEYINSITIPALKRFGFVNTINLSHAKPTDLMDFFSRHENIQELEITIITTTYPIESRNKSVKDVVDYAVKNLKNLSSFKSWDFWLAVWFIPLIRKHAKPGCVFKCESFVEIMKRYDNEVVQKIDGKWQMYTKFK